MRRTRKIAVHAAFAIGAIILPVALSGCVTFSDLTTRSAIRYIGDSLTESELSEVVLDPDLCRDLETPFGRVTLNGMPGEYYVHRRSIRERMMGSPWAVGRPSQDIFRGGESWLLPPGSYEFSWTTEGAPTYHVWTISPGSTAFVAKEAHKYAIRVRSMNWNKWHLDEKTWVFWTTGSADLGAYDLGTIDQKRFWRRYRVDYLHMGSGVDNVAWLLRGARKRFILQAYSGPLRPPAEVGTLCTSRQKHIVVECVDGMSYLPSYRMREQTRKTNRPTPVSVCSEIEMLPGEHTIQISYADESRFPVLCSEKAVILRWRVESGKRYAIEPHSDMSRRTWNPVIVEEQR